METKVLTFQFDPELGAFANRAHSAVATDKSVAGVDQDVFVHEQRPMWFVHDHALRACASPAS